MQAIIENDELYTYLEYANEELTLYEIVEIVENHYGECSYIPLAKEIYNVIKNIYVYEDLFEAYIDCQGDISKDEFNELTENEIERFLFKNDLEILSTGRVVKYQ